MAGTYLLAMWCPVYRWRDSNLGLGTELENLSGGVKGKGTSGGPARPKVLIRRTGADHLVVVMKRGNARGAKGVGHQRRGRLANWKQEEPGGRGGRRQPSVSGTSRVTGDCHARICESLGVKFPRATRRYKYTHQMYYYFGRFLHEELFLVRSYEVLYSIRCASASNRQ